MPLSAPRHTPTRAGEVFVLPVAAAAQIYQGGVVCLNGSGFAEPASTATGLIAMGIAQESVTGGASDGAVSVEVRAGVVLLASAAAGDAIARAHVGRACWLVDDAVVGNSDGNGTRSSAGLVVGLSDDPAGIWVDLRPGAVQPPAGVRRTYLTVPIATLVGTGVTRAVMPAAGTVTRLRSVINGALATGNATLTAAIAGVGGITGGVLTIAEAGSAAGDVDEAVPSAAHAVAAGQVLTLTCGGTNTNAVTALVTVEITLT